MSNIVSRPVSRRRTALVVLWLAAVAIVLAATAAAAVLNARLSATSGLNAGYEATSGASFGAVEPVISRALLDRVSRRFHGAPFRADWTGYLIVPATGTYRFAVFADLGQGAGLDVDRQRVADTTMQLGPPVTLRRGFHQLRMHYGDHGRARWLTLLWARADGPLHPLSPLLFVPDLRPPSEVRQRRLLAATAGLLPWAMLALLTPLAWAVVRRAWRRVRAPGTSAEDARLVRLLLAAAVVLFVAGAWWGLPGHGTWAPDEVRPSDVRAAVEARFANGWTTLYPPLHFALLAVAYLPHILASAAGLIDITALRAATDLALIGRLISVAMAIGLLFIVSEIGREHFGGRAGLLAAAVLAVSLPLTYYAKTMNVDVPYVFWLTLSLMFYLRSYRHGAPRDFALFCAAGVAAISTKDQAFGFYVLPALYMSAAAVIYARRPTRPRGVPSLPTLGLMAAVTAATFVVLWNLPFNLEGFREHVSLITGSSQGFRAYPSSPGGHLRLFTSAIGQIGQAMGWPFAAAAAWAIWAAIRARQRVLLYLLLPAVSYYVFFVAVIMYHYDRFYLGTIVIAAIAAGWWLQEWTAVGTAGRRWRVAAVCLALVYGASRSVALDVLMIRDSRYEVERALRARVLPRERVAVAGWPGYLPRPEMWPWRRIEADLAELERIRPTYVVLNAGYAQRHPPGSAGRDFHEALASGRAGYRLAGRYRTALPPSPLVLERRFRELRDDGLSNLPKVNPTIEVYVRE